MRVNFKVDGVMKVAERMNKVSKDIRAQNVKQMKVACIYLQNYLQREKLSGQVLRRRTGQLAGSINYDVQEEGVSIVGRVGTRKVYAKIHEYGGQVSAKNVRFLTIPLDAAKTPAGVLRKPAKEWSDTFVRTTAGGNKIMFSKESGEAVPIFLLRQSVKIPARPYMSPSIRETRPAIRDIIGSGVNTVVRHANGQ